MPPHHAELYEPDHTTLLEESKIGLFSQTFGYYDEVTYFLDCIGGGKKVEINNIDEGLKSMKLLLAIREHNDRGMIDVPG